MLFFTIWFLIFLITQLVFVSFSFGYVNLKTAYKRFFNALKNPQNFSFSTSWAILAISALWIFFLPGMVLAAISNT